VFYHLVLQRVQYWHNLVVALTTAKVVAAVAVLEIAVLGNIAAVFGVNFYICILQVQIWPMPSSKTERVAQEQYRLD
jgi:hypothetical protein